MKINIGDKVTYRAAGKVARLEDKAGRMVTGTVMGRDNEGNLHVLPDHRTLPGAVFPNLQASVPEILATKVS